MSDWDADRYLNSVTAPNISAEKEVELFTVIKSESSSEAEKQDAIDKLCRSHIRFISSYAQKYRGKCQVDLEDLIGAGVIGMMTAIDNFDLGFKVKFITYCTWWVRLEMLNLIKVNTVVKIPQNINDSIVKIRKEIKDAETELTREEIKNVLNISEKKMKHIELADLKRVPLNAPISGDNVGDGQSILIQDILATNDMTPFETYEKEDLLELLREYLSELDAKTLEILMSKYLPKKVKLHELATKYKVSQERIRQIQVKAVKDLRDKLLEVYVRK